MILLIIAAWINNELKMILLVSAGTFFLALHNMINQAGLKQQITKLENKIKEND